MKIRKFDKLINQVAKIQGLKSGGCISEKNIKLILGPTVVVHRQLDYLWNTYVADCQSL